MLGLALVACGGGDAAPAPTSTATAVASATPVPTPSASIQPLPPATVAPAATAAAAPPPASPVPSQPAPPARPATGNLSARLSRLADLAAAGTLAATPAAQAQQLGLPATGPGSLLRDGTLVVVEAGLSSAAPSQLDAIRAAGAKVISVHEPSNTATLGVEPSLLRTVASLPGVLRVQEVLAPQRN
jgi:hypothetical protein